MQRSAAAAQLKGRSATDNNNTGSVDKVGGVDVIVNTGHSERLEEFSVLNKKAGVWRTDEYGKVKFREISPVRRQRIRQGGEQLGEEKTKLPAGKKYPSSKRSRSNPEVEFVFAALEEDNQRIRGEWSRGEKRPNQRRSDKQRKQELGQPKEIVGDQRRSTSGSKVTKSGKTRVFDGEKLYQQVQQKRAQLNEPEHQRTTQWGKPKSDSSGYHNNNPQIANQGEDLTALIAKGRVEGGNGHPRKETRSERSPVSDLNQSDTAGGRHGKAVIKQDNSTGFNSVRTGTNVSNTTGSSSTSGIGSDNRSRGSAVTDRVQSQDTLEVLTHQKAGINQRGVNSLKERHRTLDTSLKRGRRLARKDFQRRAERDSRFLPKERSHSPRIRRSVKERKSGELLEGHVTSGRISPKESGSRGETVGDQKSGQQGDVNHHDDPSRSHTPDSGRQVDRDHSKESHSKVEVSRENKGNLDGVGEEVRILEAGERRKHDPGFIQRTRPSSITSQNGSDFKREPARPETKPRFNIPIIRTPQSSETAKDNTSSQETRNLENSKTRGNEGNGHHGKEVLDNGTELKESYIRHQSGSYVNRLKSGEGHGKNALSAIPEGEKSNNSTPGLRVKTQPRFQKNRQGGKREGGSSPVPSRALHRQQHYRRATGRQQDREQGNSTGEQHDLEKGNRWVAKVNNFKEQKKSSTLDRERRVSPEYNPERNTFGLPRRAVSCSSLLESQNTSSERGGVRGGSTSPSSSKGGFESESETSRLYDKPNQPKIYKYHQKTNLKLQKKFSQSQTNLSKLGSSSPNKESSFFRKLGSQLDLRILKVLSPRKGSKSKAETSTISTDSSTEVSSDHRPQIRSPRYQPPSPSSSPTRPERSQIDESIAPSQDPNTSTDSSEMYRRVTTSYHREFDDVRLRRSFDLGRDLPDRPQSAMFFSQGDLPDFLDGAGETHFRPRSESDVDISKLATINRSRSGDRIVKMERSSSPGFRGVGSPSSGRAGRDRRKQKMLSAGGNMVKMPRQPRPKRMKIILDYLKKGVVNCIELQKQKLEAMKQQLMDGHAHGRSSQGLQYNLEKHMKTTERLLRKLEFHLAKVEELQEQYDKELKVRDGAENILRAFSEANSSKAKGSVSEAKQQVKDCTQNMCHLEAELEVNLGVFIMKIEGIAGFARVCRGDVFEISFKYGFQKWKSKCKVEKDLSQTWENAEVMFYPMLADYLQIKVTEIRGIARSNIIIGSLEFDSSDFYQAEPQNLTIDVNEAGTIKLNVVVSWSPFQIVEEDLKAFNKNSYGRRERSFTESSVPNYRPQSMVSPPISSKPDPPPSVTMLPSSGSLDLDDVPMLTLAESLHNVNRLLEILHGQYVELRTLEKQVSSLENYLRKKSNMDRDVSTSSLSIKNALDSFNFLDEVDEGLSDDGGDGTEETNKQNLAEKSTSVPKSKSLDHLQIAASKVEKDGSISASRPDLRLANRQDRPSAKRSSRFLDLSEKRESRMLEVNEQRSSGILDSPTVDSSFGSLGRSSIESESEPLSTGSEPIDMVLVQHLMYTEYQLSHLGAFGPLKLKETLALDKLQKQAVIIEQLVVLSSSGEENFRADDILPELKLNPTLLEFWQQCSEKHALYVSADLFLLQLDVKFGVKLRTNHPDIADDVFQSLGHRIIERPIDLLDPKAIITLFQYITFFAHEDRKNPERFINDLTNEFELTASLEPGDVDLPKIVKKLPRGVLLPTGNLRALGLLLLEESDTIKNGVRSYLESICNNPKTRQKAIHVYAECLEERDLSLRQAGCVALAAMKARETLDQLVYLLRCDMDDVKQTVKEALMTFGEEGRQAYQSLSIQPYTYSYTQQKSDGPLLTTEL